MTKAVIRKLRLKIEELENEVSLLRQGSNTSISQEVNLYEPPVHNYCTCFFFMSREYLVHLRQLALVNH